MVEYIEREAAMLTPVLPKEYRQYQTGNLDDAYEQGWEDALNNLKNAPAADVAPVVHGRWEMRRNSWYCVNCNKGYKITYGLLATSAYNYCPNCGAKMDGGSSK